MQVPVLFFCAGLAGLVAGGPLAPLRERADDCQSASLVVKALKLGNDTPI